MHAHFCEHTIHFVTGRHTGGGSDRGIESGFGQAGRKNGGACDESPYRGDGRRIPEATVWLSSGSELEYFEYSPLAHCRPGGGDRGDSHSTVAATHALLRGPGWRARSGRRNHSVWRASV